MHGEGAMSSSFVSDKFLCLLCTLAIISFYESSCNLHIMIEAPKILFQFRCVEL
jgi:hypothetical protein